METMVRLIYASRMSSGLSHKQLDDILQVSRRNNEKRAVTGALCYSAKGFLQCLEGPADAVNALYGHIVRDDRHVDVTLLSYGPLSVRSFSQWAMAYVRADEVDAGVVLKHCAQRTFDPFAMNPEQALGFLVEIVAQRQASAR
jgi:hypothetical protein